MMSPVKNVIRLRKNQRNIRLGQIGTDLWSVRINFFDCLDRTSREVLPIIRPMFKQLETYTELCRYDRYSFDAFGLYRGDVTRLFPKEDKDGYPCHGLGALLPCDGSVVTDYTFDDLPYVSISTNPVQRFALTKRPLPGSPMELRDITQALDWLAAMIRPRAMLLDMTIEAANDEAIEQFYQWERAKVAAVAERHARNLPLR
ncbi:MAG TPA: hypothetical protein VHL31_19165 [Geminicoccus sp.]|jgi:hypothetical protein|uniref:hypothetical protein n=1 Tax=Geminicoccus sp. TaxID=2024832 RepID=UPI002E349250|nr:hypothetical protein [Geminicoccus sp.]HEX2528405.1 hypothetical protein [Geminicoccus sp.]